jgi:hypothetical protein
MNRVFDVILLVMVVTAIIFYLPVSITGLVLISAIPEDRALVLTFPSFLLVSIMVLCLANICWHAIFLYGSRNHQLVEEAQNRTYLILRKVSFIL